MVLKQRWTTKPPFGIQLDLGHPLVAGLVLYLPFSEMTGPGNALFRQNSGLKLGTELGGSTPWIGGRGGATRKWDGSTFSTWYERGTDLEPTNAVTMLGGVRSGGSLPDSARPFGKTNGNGGVSPFLSYDIEYDVGHAAPNNVRANAGFVTGGLVSTADYTLPDSTVPHVAGIRAVNAGNVDLIVNGVVQASAAAGTTFSYDTTSTGRFIVSGQSSAAASATWSGEIYWTAVWNRALTTAELRQVCLNPYQLFQPRVVPMAQTVAGGGVRPLFLNDQMAGMGTGGSFFRNPLA